MTTPPEKQKPKNILHAVMGQITGAVGGCLRETVEFIGLLLIFTIGMSVTIIIAHQLIRALF